MNLWRMLFNRRDEEHNRRISSEHLRRFAEQQELREFERRLQILGYRLDVLREAHDDRRK